MRVKDQKRLEAEFEADVNDADAWEQASVSPSHPRRALGAQITVRLGPDTAELLRKRAQEAGMGYTALVRRFIDEALKGPSGAVVTMDTPGTTTDTPSGQSARWSTSRQAAVELEEISA